ECNSKGKKKCDKFVLLASVSAMHLLPLPGFLLMGSNIWQHFIISVGSDPFKLLNINLYLPEQIVYLIFNMMTQYVCISSVYVLTAECTSLTVTLVLTLRKFVSLLISIVYFKNPFTLYHWMGTILVFTGTVIFTEAYPKTLWPLVTRQGYSNDHKKAQMRRSKSSVLLSCNIFCVSLITFVTYVLIVENNVLDATETFVSLSLFNSTATGN
ncbi:hypothetical protein GQX74_010948, partial [Glossina fuscipes]